MKNFVKPATLSLLTAVVVMCLAVLSVLTLSQSGADKKVAERYSENIRQDYLLEAQAQEWLKSFDSQLQQGLIAESKITQTVGDVKEKHIDIELVVDTNKRSYSVAKWRTVPPAVEESVLENIWGGNN